MVLDVRWVNAPVAIARLRAIAGLPIPQLERPAARASRDRKTSPAESRSAVPHCKGPGDARVPANGRSPPGGRLKFTYLGEARRYGGLAIASRAPLLPRPPFPTTAETLRDRLLLASLDLEFPIAALYRNMD